METAARIKVYLDSANLDEIRKAALDCRIDGVTTNPSLIRDVVTSDYATLGRALSQLIAPKVISLPVLSLEPSQLRDQALRIAEWGNNVFVKVPCVTPSGAPTFDSIEILATRGVRINVTAVTTREQIDAASEVLGGNLSSIISIIAGRISDTGSDAVRTVKYAVDRAPKACEILWASTRQLYSIVEAQRAGCHIITVPPAILARMSRMGGRCEDLSREMVTEFVAAAAGIAWEGA